VNSRKRKYRVCQLLAGRFLISGRYWNPGWNVDGEIPVGCEFGSPDYEALSELDGFFNSGTAAPADFMAKRERMPIQARKF
jgi:hypothetical protein